MFRYDMECSIISDWQIMKISTRPRSSVLACRVPVTDYGPRFSLQYCLESLDLSEVFAILNSHSLKAVLFLRNQAFVC